MKQKPEGIKRKAFDEVHTSPELPFPPLTNFPIWQTSVSNSFCPELFPPTSAQTEKGKEGHTKLAPISSLPHLINGCLCPSLLLLLLAVQGPFFGRKVHMTLSPVPFSNNYFPSSPPSIFCGGQEMLNKGYAAYTDTGCSLVWIGKEHQAAVKYALLPQA